MAASSSESDNYGASRDELIKIIDNAAEDSEGPESRALSSMSDDQKVRVATILRDPDFAAPGKERALEERYPEVEVVEEFGNTDGWQANITLHRALQNSVSGRQGLRVDGNGKRIRTRTL